MLVFFTWLLALVSSAAVSQEVGADEGSIVHWYLENYNAWNLPFGKTVEISSRDGGAHQHDFPGDRYLMEVDPAALFSILWLSE